MKPLKTKQQNVLLLTKCYIDTNQTSSPLRSGIRYISNFTYVKLYFWAQYAEKTTDFKLINNF